ncbi:spore germination protein [Virgibacillus oceani]|uniref:Spore germination protein n=1 Tax=Virgibacillus oceani TaxID=1479511 RepID=A0A917M8Z1_9BACI|nr:spore germination protein [Virgibacillus oceani]GGG85312.1 spore germination protein [Virgibacillus oceani]
MRRNRNRKTNTDSIFPLKIDELKKIIKDKFEKNPDLTFNTYEQNNKKIAVFFISYQTDPDKVENFLLEPLLKIDKEWTGPTIKNEIPLSPAATANKLEDILRNLIIGEAFVYVEDEDAAISYALIHKEKRQVSKPENETVVLGPQIAFTESLITNLNVVRWSLRSTDLVLEKILIGKRAPREVRLIYMKSIANETHVNTMRQRLQDLDVDEIEDSNVLSQYIEDSSSTIFPQFYTTELPDRFCYTVGKGRIGVLVENSPTGILAPSTLFSFLESTEDLYMRWNMGSFLRILRFVAMFISVILTPLYVAAVTYHYELIPPRELITLGQSRAVVPFPPIIEALILEFLIELLREAGARLPTKVGQTIGIVGGVIIGQAVVQAGLTSSILIIVIAMSALASFTAPSYLMGTTIRVIRFPMIFLAGMFGLIGIIYGICFLIIHLLKIKSLGEPYLAPVYPFRWADLNKALYRAPYAYQYKRFLSFRPKDLLRFKKREAIKKHDIDE